jgi:carbon-monoxide dehydrogenase medium subunit
MIAADFDYLRPRDIDEALAALADPEARLIAGGHSLIPLMKLRFARPTTLVDIGRLDLAGVGVEDGRLRVGALTTYDELLRTDMPVPDALREAAASVGDAQIRNAGTIGGAVAHCDPASDIAAALLALDAVVRVRGLDGSREVEIGEFFRGPYETALAQQELVEEFVLDVPAPGDGSAYAAIEDAASGYPLAGAAAAVRAGRVWIGLTGAGPHPLRLPEGNIEEALAQLEVAGAGEDAAYRRHLAEVVVRRVVETAHRRAEGGR